MRGVGFKNSRSVCFASVGCQASMNIIPESSREASARETPNIFALSPWASVRFGAHPGLKSDITALPKSATKGDAGVFRPEDCARSRYSV